MKDQRVPEDKRRRWEKHYVFLMKPFTYIVVHTLADFFGIHQRHSQGFENSNAVAVDVAENIRVLIESVKGYLHCRLLD